MKFDVVRAWKDETYRESLGEEQLSLLPANPAGELTETDLGSVCGGGGFEPSGIAPVGVGAGAAGFFGESVGSSHIHSFAVLCDISVFSINVNVIAQILPILSPNNNVCAESH